MAQKESYYKVLGVDKSATPEEIKKAFRKKAAKAHPDVGGDEEEFKKINEAYEVLSNPEKRKQYDTYGQYMGSMPGGGAGAYGAGAAWPGNVNVKWTNMGGDGQGFGGFGDFDLGDIFNRVSHGEGVWGTDWEMPKRPMRGRDLQATLNLSFDEAFNGTTKRLSVRIPSSGKTQHVTVKVPAGAVDGGKLRYRGKGDEGLDGGEPGDLVIVTKVAPHPLFTRKGADVLMDLPVRGDSHPGRLQGKDPNSRWHQGRRGAPPDRQGRSQAQGRQGPRRAQAHRQDRRALRADRRAA